MTDTYRTRIVTAPQPGGPDALRLEEIVLEAPAPGEVLIEVAAAGINRPDVFERMGFYPPPPGAPKGLGLEVSGTVLAVGEGVKGLPEGQRVCALVAGGGYADIVRAHASAVLPVPDGVDLVDAAGLPETVMTVWTNVFDTGALKPGERLLVHGGSSGIGTTAIQTAKAHGAIVMTTAGSAQKCATCRSLGADHVFNYREDDWVEGVKAAGGADVVLDMVGGDYVAKNLAVLNRHGRLVQIAFLKGSRVEVDLMGLMLKRQTVTGSTLRARSAEEKAALAKAVQAHVWPWVEAGKVRPVIDSRFALTDVAKAHERMDSMAHIGKILLIP
ncbi:MAG: NAD(P)H-quinone oxidoreductase [Caulobacterales bacterium]|uniref:NAD(P)H-quinone oxidoreductase n=1 Tax=Glycocaulis sp. TaxID=1969725 RepID=UPI003FA0386F